MTPQQNKNTLDWVEAMLSGHYSHNKHQLFIPNTNLYSALGLACGLAGWPMQALMDRYTGTVSQHWFDARFGTNRQVGVIKTMNDLTNDYFAVCALLLNSCLVGERQHNLHLDMMEKYREANKAPGTDLQPSTVGAIQSKPFSPRSPQRGKE